MTPNVVLVTGVGGTLGGNLAARLAANPDIERVLGVDTAPPAGDATTLGRVEFIRADIRDPLIAKIISSARVDTVVHASTAPGPASKELNIIGTMQLLAACQRSSAVRKLVVKSTTAVYGGGPPHRRCSPRTTPRWTCRTGGTPGRPSRSRVTSAGSRGGGRMW